MLKEGENTYATAAFADEYIAMHYAKYAPLRVHWSVLTEEEKEQYLIASLEQIEKMTFAGRKYNGSQPLQFPRVYMRTGLGIYGYSNPYLFGDGEIPEDVKKAQTENALGIISEQINAISDKQFMTMQSLGAVKNTKYNKREAGDLGYGAELKGGNVDSELASNKAFRLLSPYLGGAYRC